MTTATATATAEKTINWSQLLSTLNLETDQQALVPLNPQETDKPTQTRADESSRLMASLALLLANTETSDGYNKALVQALIDRIDSVIERQVNEVMQDEQFKTLQSAWLAIHDLVQDTDFKANTVIDLLDCSKAEVAEDFEANSVDITGSEVYRKIYVAEYDQFGGLPYGAVLGLYDFEYATEDLDWLSTMGKIAQVSHSPFIGSVSPKFFGCNTVEDLSRIKDIEGLMSHPKYARWEKFRKTEQATYVGLTLPRYLLRSPYDADINPARKPLQTFQEAINPNDDNNFVWGPASILFAKNLTRSFKQTGWCQHIRGVRGGGCQEDLTAYPFNVRGKEEIKPPVEMVIPDHLELAFAKCGFIPLVGEKGATNACFFSTQSIKKVEEFVDPRDSENSAMIANLSYTFSVTRIAHYIKTITRQHIGSNVDAPYLQNLLTQWINRYVTIAPNPDSLTLQYYPFKAASVTVSKRDGALGWYDCSFKILPHIQFEGMDVEMMLDTRLDTSQ